MAARVRPYLAARGLEFRAHLEDWAAHAERRFAAKMAANGADLELAMLDVVGIGWVDGGITAAMVKRALDRHPDAKRIVCTINSPGGYCSEGTAIYNLLKRHPAHVEVDVIGEAASAASVIAMAGDKILMRPGTWMMIHPAQCLALGSAADMRKAAEMLDVCTEGAIDIYTRRTKRDSKEIAALVDAETWMTADQAVAGGFADELVDREEPAADDVGPEPEHEDDPDDGASLRGARRPNLLAELPRRAY